MPKARFGLLVQNCTACSGLLHGAIVFAGLAYDFRRRCIVIFSADPLIIGKKASNGQLRRLDI